MLEEREASLPRSAGGYLTKLRKEKTMDPRTKVHMCLILGAAIMAVLNPEPLMAQEPVIQAILPENGAAAGYGQMITIQGFNLIQLGNFAGTTVAFTNKKGDVCSDVFLYQAPSTANELYVRILNPAGPCDIGKGKYKVTVSTPDGTSDPWDFQVKKKPEAPILRKVLFPGDLGCPADSSDYDICVQAYGTDTSHITAVFRQDRMKISAPLITTIASPAMGLTHGFKLPELTSGETALVQLGTTVNEVDSKLSAPLLFTVP